MNDVKNKQTYSKEAHIWLWNYSLNYLARYEVSAAKLRRKLYERQEKFPYEIEDENYKASVESVIDKLISLNLLSDIRYGSSRFRQLINRGKSLTYIRQDLRQNGIDADIIDNIIEEQQKQYDEDSNIIAAINYMRRRRLGAFGNALNEDNQDKEAAYKAKQKQVAAMARQGFSYDLITQLLAKTRDELEDILAHAD